MFDIRVDSEVNKCSIRLSCGYFLYSRDCFAWKLSHLLIESNVDHTDFGAGGGGSVDVGVTNLLLSEGPSATCLFAATFLPWFKLTTRLPTGITGSDRGGGAESDRKNLPLDPPSDIVCLGGGGLWWGGGLGWVLVWDTAVRLLSWSVLPLLDLVSKLCKLQTHK